MTVIPVETILPYAGRFGVFPTYVENSLAKVPAGRAMFPNLRGETRTRAVGALLTELRGRATTAEEVARWWSGPQSYGVGLNCGDYQCLDFDDPTAIAAWHEALRANGAEGLLDRTASAETMSGGLHIWAYVPGCRESSRKLARHAEPQWDERRGKSVVARIETRGAGGYALVPPSPGYRWSGPRTVLDLLPLAAEEYATLVRAATSLDRGAPEETREKGRGKRPKGDVESPNEWFERTASWDDLLVQAGGRFFREVGGRRQYTRPGKTKGVSITTGNGHAGQDLAKVHTPNWPPFEDGEVLSKYFCYAALHHGRDKAAATRAIAAMPGYGRVVGGEPWVVDGEIEDKTLALPSVKEEGRGSERHERPDSSTPARTTTRHSLLTDSPEFLRNDLGNARRLVHRHGDDLRYCADWARFLAWDDVRWRQDTRDGATTRRLAHGIADALVASEDKALRLWGYKSGSSAAISAMLRETQALVPVASEALDAHDHLLCVTNGVLDLSTGRLVEGASTRDLLLTKQAPVAWDPDATCPRFEQFLKEIMRERPELVTLLLRMLGYCLTGSTREQKFFLLYGERGRNGKTTLVELMQKLLGNELCGPMNKKLLTASDRDSARFAMASLEGRRMVFTNENTKGRAYDTEFMKEFAGGSTVQAEKKGQDEYSFRLRAKLLHSVNAMPSAEWSSSYGDRAVPIPFEQSWYPKGSADWREGDLEPDRELDAKLRAELPGILTLLVTMGSVPWYSEGLTIPKAVATLLEAYRAENDDLGAWITERCETGPEFRVGMQEAYESFRAFMKASGIPYRGRINGFKKEIVGRPGLGHAKPHNRSTILGLRLRPEHDLYDDEA